MAEREWLELCFWQGKDPSESFLGDQYGRPIRGVTSFSVSRQAGQRDRVEIHATNLTVQPIAAAKIPPNKKLEKVEIGGQESIAVDSKYVVLLKLPADELANSSHETLLAIRTRATEEFQKLTGREVLVLILPNTAELDIIEVGEGRTKDPPIPLSRPADWDF